LYSEIVTKKYFKKELKAELSNFVTKNDMKEQKYEILREVRVIIFESLETIKVYFEEQGNRHREALLQGFRDELLVYKDEVMSHKEKLDDHGHRIKLLEAHH